MRPRFFTRDNKKRPLSPAKVSSGHNERAENDARKRLMMQSHKVGDLKQVGQFGRDYVLVTRDSEVNQVNEDYVSKDIEPFRAFFAKINDGAFEELWGMTRGIPYNDDYAELVLFEPRNR